MGLAISDWDGLAISGVGLGVGTTMSGLIPALPISTEPNGIPVREAPPGTVGDVAAVVLQVPNPVVLPGNDVPIVIVVLPGNAAPIAIPPPS